MKRLSRDISKYHNDPVRYIVENLLVPALASDDNPIDRSLALDLMEKCWSVEGLTYEALYECAIKEDQVEAARLVADVQRTLRDIPNEAVRACLQPRITELFRCYGPWGRILNPHPKTS